MDAKDFFDDKKTIMTCAFTIFQIEELVNIITNDTIKKYPLISWSRIKGIKNKIMYDYENIDISILWATIKESLPKLKDELKDIILKDKENIF